MARMFFTLIFRKEKSSGTLCQYVIQRKSLSKLLLILPAKPSGDQRYFWLGKQIFNLMFGLHHLAVFDITVCPVPIASGIQKYRLSLPDPASDMIQQRKGRPAHFRFIDMLLHEILQHIGNETAVCKCGRFFKFIAEQFILQIKERIETGCNDHPLQQHRLPDLLLIELIPHFGKDRFHFSVLRLLLEIPGVSEQTVLPPLVLKLIVLVLLDQLIQGF